jgi:HEAT repeat protein
MRLSESAPSGGARVPPRRALRRCSLATALCILIVAPAPSADASPAPRLRALLKAGRLVVDGQVATVKSYDDDRVAVVEFRVDKIFKGNLPGEPPQRVSIVEVREGPVRPGLDAGMRGIAVLRPAPRTTLLAKVLPEGTYYELLPEHGSFIAAASPGDAGRNSAVVDRLVAAARGSGLDASAARQLTFALLASQSPILVEDGIAGVAKLGRQAALTAEELGTLRTALGRADLPEQVRIALIEAVAAAGIGEAVPALQAISTPPAVVEAAWQALDRLGAAPPDESLQARLADREASIRAAAARELLRREGVEAISQIAPLAIQDPDPSVRMAAVEALGALKKPEALPPLERVFSSSSPELQQASARAIIGIGGQPAIDALGRLAFAGPGESQRYAVVVLMTVNDERKTEVLQRIGATHPEEEVRDLALHGLDVHEH